VDFDYIGGIVQTVSSLNGFNCLLTWTKALSYISLFHRSSSMLIENITRSALNLGVLMGMFLIILWAYAQTLYVSFGTQLDSWKTIKSSVFGVVEAIVTNLDIDELRGQDQVLGFLLAVSFLVVCLFSLLNMLLAIIMVTYDEITSEVIEDPVDTYFREGIKQQWRDLMRFIQRLAGSIRRPAAQLGDLCLFCVWRRRRKVHELPLDRLPSTGGEGIGRQIKSIPSACPILREVEAREALRLDDANSSSDDEPSLQDRKLLQQVRPVPLSALLDLTETVQALTKQVASLHDRLEEAESAYLKEGRAGDQAAARLLVAQHLREQQ